VGQKTQCHTISSFFDSKEKLKAEVEGRWVYQCQTEERRTLSGTIDLISQKFPYSRFSDEKIGGLKEHFGKRFWVSEAKRLEFVNCCSNMERIQFPSYLEGWICFKQRIFLRFLGCWKALILINYEDLIKQLY